MSEESLPHFALSLWERAEFQLERKWKLEIRERVWWIIRHSEGNDILCPKNLSGYLKKFLHFAQYDMTALRMTVLWSYFQYPHTFTPEEWRCCGAISNIPIHLPPKNDGVVRHFYCFPRWGMCKKNTEG